MILIGSRALKLRAFSLFKRQCQDFDFIATQDEVTEWLSKNLSKFKHFKAYSLEGKHDKYIVEGDSICEFELVKPNTSTEMLVDLVKKDSQTIETSFGLLPSLDMLFTIKSSHKHLKNSPFFWKNLSDYHLMKQMGAVVRPEFQDFLKLREKETYASQKHPSLMQSKNDFFKDDGINYTFDHDDIHQAVRHLDKPAYQYYMKDGSEVFSDKDKFFSCSLETQFFGVIEECSVLAIERSLVPHPSILTPEQAWRFAFSKVCTSITSGFFRSFAYENAPEILKRYPANYWEKFQEAVKNNQVRYM